MVTPSGCYSTFFVKGALMQIDRSLAGSGEIEATL